MIRTKYDSMIDVEGCRALLVSAMKKRVKWREQPGDEGRSGLTQSQSIILPARLSHFRMQTGDEEEKKRPCKIGGGEG